MFSLKNELVVGLIIGLFICSCKQFQKATDLVIQPTARELYKREFSDDTILFRKWQEAFEKGLADSLKIELPYTEKGKFYGGSTLVHSYNLNLRRGRIFHAEIRTDSINQKVFLDLYENSSDSLADFKLVSSNEGGEKELEYRVERSGNYKLIVQPELHLESNFELALFDSPLYDFPVLASGDAAIQSFWGAERDGGNRRHEGLDIFAERGTPVLAVAKGRISSTGNRGLGGKQVWLKTGLFGHSLYYAHLDSIWVKTTQRVNVGDTLGLVGNTGNARTTKPHLHFGIYQGYRGAVDPLPFVQRTKQPQEFEELEIKEDYIVVTSPKANLRNEAYRSGEKIGEVKRNDTLQLLGFTDKWAHIKIKSGQKAYVHRSLIAMP